MLTHSARLKQVQLLQSVMGLNVFQITNAFLIYAKAAYALRKPSAVLIFMIQRINAMVSIAM